MANGNNNETTGMAVALGFVAAMFFFLFLFVYAVLAFLALVLSVLCLAALEKPLTIGKMTITPDEARAFLLRGVIGAAMLPAFVAFACGLLNTRIVPDYWIHIVIAGYAIGSIGIEILMAQNESSEGEIIPPGQAQLPPPLPEEKPETPPFRFASWDDEEKRP